MKVFQCSICEYIHHGDRPPGKCPVCGADSSKFIEIDEADGPEKAPGGKRVEKLQLKGSSQKIEKPADGSSKSIPDNSGDTGFEKIKALLIKHHAHPILVHTPNGILPAAVVLWILAWIFSAELLAKTAMINLIFVIFSLPFVILTGVLEWQKKYMGAMTLIFKLKFLAVAGTTTCCLISLVWYLSDPSILSTPKAWVFILINCIMLAGAGLAGHIGGKLIFKD